jgi:hypothetical protein
MDHGIKTATRSFLNNKQTLALVRGYAAAPAAPSEQKTSERKDTPEQKAVESKGTSATTVQLDPSIAKHLKPHVIQAINSKTDQLLIKKLNFVGVSVAVRLNTANKIVLQSLSQENCLRILTEELQDPWEYYWLVVRENGNDADKWLESLQEVKDLPVVAHRCWIEMQKNGVYPKLQHYHTFFQTLSLTADYHALHQEFDAMKRRNIVKSKATEESYNLVLNLWLNKGLYPMAKLAADLCEFRGFAVSQENAARLEELKSKYDEDAAAEYFYGNIKEEPLGVKYAREAEARLRQNAKDMIESYYQPPMEKLVVKD